MQVHKGFQDLEDELARMRPIPRLEFSQQLKVTLMQRLGQSIQGRPAAMSFRFPLRLRWAALALLVLATLYLLTPAGQALAQQILQLGIFTVTNNPSSAEQALEYPELMSDSQLGETVAVEADDVSRAAGFPVFLPQSLPTDYRSVDNPPITLLINSQGEITAVQWMLAEVSSGDILYFSQHPFPPEEELSPRELGIGDTAGEAVTVGENQGLWLPDHAWGSRVNELGTPEPVYFNVLIWLQTEPDGHSNYFWLGSQAKLGREQMLDIAQSLTRR